MSLMQMVLAAGGKVALQAPVKTASGAQQYGAAAQVSIASVNIGTDDPKRNVIFVWSYEVDQVVSDPISSVTIGGVNATVSLVASMSGNQGLGPYYMPTYIALAQVPTGTTATVVLNYANGYGPRWMAWHAYSAIGDMQAPSSIAVQGSGPTLSLTSSTSIWKKGGFVIGTYHGGGSSPNLVTGAGWTDDGSATVAAVNEYQVTGHTQINTGADATATFSVSDTGSATYTMGLAGFY